MGHDGRRVPATPQARCKRPVTGGAPGVSREWRGSRDPVDSPIDAPKGGQGLTARILVDTRRSGPTADPDTLQLSETVVPMPGASMRVLEFLISAAALAVAVLLGFIR